MPQSHEVEVRDVSKLSDEELERMIAGHLAAPGRDSQPVLLPGLGARD
jgi:hypothetical protein